MSELVSEGMQAVSQAGIQRRGDRFAEGDGFCGILAAGFLDDKRTGKRQDSSEFFGTLGMDKARGFPEKA